jgi:hypothetical protein
MRVKGNHNRPSRRLMNRGRRCIALGDQHRLRAEGTIAFKNAKTSYIYLWIYQRGVALDGCEGTQPPLFAPGLCEFVGSVWLRGQGLTLGGKP